MDKPFKNILIINLGGLGDLLLSTPGLRALKNNYPEAHISIMVTPAVSEFAKSLPYINNVYSFRLGPGLAGFDNLKTLICLRRKRFDLAVNMRTLVSKKSALKIKFLLDIIDPRIRAGRNTENRGDFFDIKIPEKDAGEKYEMEYDIEMVKALGAKVIDKNMDFKIDGDAAEKVKKLLEEASIFEHDVIVGIHIGGRPSRRWPVENFLKTIEIINEKMEPTLAKFRGSLPDRQAGLGGILSGSECIKCKFITTGNNNELALINQLIKKSDVPILNLAGKLDIRELGALIKRCDFYISNDTGVMHIAATLKTPLAAIFGPGDIKRFDPRNISDNAIVLYKKINCSPCDKITCGSMRCLKMISPEEVAGAALSFLNKRGGDGLA